jgi:hypothetical protein
MAAGGDTDRHQRQFGDRLMAVAEAGAARPAKLLGQVTGEEDR